MYLFDLKSLLAFAFRCSRWSLALGGRRVFHFHVRHVALFVLVSGAVQIRVRALAADGMSISQQQAAGDCCRKKVNKAWGISTT
jgi:hypothetical protein